MDGSPEIGAERLWFGVVELRQVIITYILTLQWDIIHSSIMASASCQGSPRHSADSLTVTRRDGPQAFGCLIRTHYFQGFEPGQILPYLRHFCLNPQLG